MELLVGFIAIIFVCIIAIPVSLYFAWAASHLWVWFLVPLGLPPLSILQIWGICLTISMFRPKFNFAKENNDNWAAGVFAIIVAPPLSLGIGYLIKFYWM